ncbi:MAG: hypothetical protein QOI43_2418 [Gaiellales bacterium]|nr:hypothetical protein [Gaiellales bacterium]
MPGRIYQLKATIIGTKPPVWRRLLVAETTSLFELHEVLQAAFGWWNSHLYEFEIGGVRYGTDDGEGFGPPPKSERRTRLGAVTEAGTTFTYLYDFGDNWQHSVVVEKIIAAAPGATYPACIAGRRACPPEDCGGVWGYAEFLAAVSDPAHPEHDSMLEWAGGAFDPERFATSDFDERLDRS